MILIVFLTLLSTVVIVTKSSRTVAAISTDKSNYDPDETVTISGFFFVSNAKVDVEVIRPDGTLSNWLIESGAEGLFFTTYGPDATTGMYTVKASDGVSGTETSFMVKAPVAAEQVLSTQPESSVDFKQP